MAPRHPLAVRMFGDRVDEAIASRASVLCVGLDPDPARMPIDNLVTCNRAIVDATVDLVCAFKRQLAFYVRDHP
jgi:orotidine-5'-phosphate decarboxylase